MIFRRGAARPPRSTREPSRAQRFRRSRAVSRILSPVGSALRPRRGVTAIPLARPSLAGSSDRPGGMGRAALVTPPYLVLLRAGFCLPPALPRARCALTAPFHHYPSTRPRLSARPRSGRYVFCATVLQVTLTGRYPAHCPAEFGLSSLPPAARTPRAERLPSGPTAAELSKSVRNPVPAGCCTARASCTGCCAASRSLRPSSRCSTRSRAASRPGTPVRPTP